MSSAQGIIALTSALVHPSVKGQLDRARHETFMARTLSVAFATFAVAPFFLAFHGAPCLAQSFVFLCGLAHLAAAMVVGRTGRLAIGHLICFVAITCVGLTLFAGLHAGAGCAIAWLMLAQFDAAQTQDRPFARAAACVTVTMLCAVVAGSFDPRFATIMEPGVIALVEAAAFGLAIHGTQTMLHLAMLARATDNDRTARWLTIAETFGDTLVVFDGGGAVDYASKASLATFGAAEDGLRGRGLFERVHVADRPAFLKAIADAAHGDETMTATIRMRAAAPDGGIPRDLHYLWIEMRARGSRDPAPATVIALLRDVTATHEQMLEMDTARRSVDEATASKDQFIANMSHELRTPLNAIIGFSDILGSLTTRPDDPTKQRHYARIINQSGHHLLSVVNSILDLSKLRSGTFSIIAEPFDVAPLIDHCCDVATLKAAGETIEIVRDYPSDLDPIIGDKRACRQILINLLSNAVKFTPSGGRIVVRARPDGNTLVLSVSDSGIGIEATDLARLGNAFFQARATTNRTFDGAGLGLSVVRGLIGLIGGAISIESEPGAGTCVTLRLPLDCRITPSVGSEATIETIARRHRSDVVKPLASRIKQSA